MPELRPHSALAVAGGPPFELPLAADGWAFFIDVDGTLIDIAATPDTVVVPPDLANQMKRVGLLADGALAIVSGRTVAMIDRLFAPVELTAAGLHGDQLRQSGGPLLGDPAPPALADLRPQLIALAGGRPGLVIEDKGNAIGVHFRGDPAAGPAIELAVDALVAGTGGQLAAQRGKMVVEVRPARAGKDNAVRRLMAAPPFAGRRPLALGDDVTDEAMFNAVNALGGVSVRIGTDQRPTVAAYRLRDPSEVRAWIAELAGALS